ncbi:DUF4198 domain-containing protein [Edwardsiella anguillarum]|uniref:DUF4198 domain-containing protein n=1 Tax=Edwardsiella anguillarum TaxID=1821960 RepID=UPI0024B86488|nr:DUF4198 domain-containing protein [Edwardsiella anguillarum]WHP81212.1 DUF4198 domain-containing protein [Edwardsiella anguillarum]WHQ18713.1 DUF4198 domain-containing protein [Edwardsiella anguillarum]WHQ22255.1 DUF4198 domain-containing protein [Edwardsiella anguillarum]WHQ25777.1 DUF4198 domain-containing protein [Edwardsiella anguillarum]WHQ29300.1 DUF4198 domain-containing protein [Edwardsiella anguillarum]
MLAKPMHLLIPLGLLLILNTASAHEFLIKPEKSQLSAGESVRIEAISSHIFMVNEEMENLSDVTLALYQGGVSTPLPLHEQPQHNTLDAQVVLPQAGSALLVGHRLPQIWCETTEGMLPGDRATLEAQGKKVISVNRYEKFAKTLLNPTPGDTTYQQVLGQKLELILLTNPADIKGNGKVKVQSLLDGQPLQSTINITYDGYSQEYKTYLANQQSDSQGIAEFTITQPGLWLLHAGITQSQSQSDINKHDLRATLVFPIAE